MNAQKILQGEIAAAQRVLENTDTLQKGVKYRKFALDAAKQWGVKNRTTKAVDLLVLGNKKIAERELDIKNLAEYMTDEELVIYSGILMTEGRAEAEKFLDTMREELRDRAFEHEQYPERFKKTAAQLYNNPLGLPEGEYQGRT